MEIKQVNILGQSYDIKDAFARALVADEYSASSSYSEGDLCIYDDNLYKCLSSTTGSWDSSAWSSTTIVDNLGSGDIYEVTQEDWNLAKEYIEGTLEEITLDIEKIQISTFWSYSLLQSVNFPDCISIGIGAFWGCISLQSVNFPVCTSINQYAFQGCISLQSVNFPVCTNIGSWAFQNCKSLQSVNFPVCTSIDQYAFASCTSLQSISFPNCTYISGPAFSSCTSLQSVIFPVCSFIGYSGFYRCTSLSKIILLYSGVCTLYNSNAFYSTPISDSSYLGYYGSIYVPSSLVNEYKIATNWTYYSDRIIGY